jgi:hypothetical protein
MNVRRFSRTLLTGVTSLAVLVGSLVVADAIDITKPVERPHRRHRRAQGPLLLGYRRRCLLVVFRPVRLFLTVRSIRKCC